MKTTIKGAKELKEVVPAFLENFCYIPHTQHAKRKP
jgi:hypothetical protein